jgi:hypothetical protein
MGCGKEISEEEDEPVAYGSSSFMLRLRAVGVDAYCGELDGEKKGLLCLKLERTEGED